MVEEIAVENGRISDFEEPMTLTLIRWYCIPSCITHRPLPTYQISLKSKKLFCGRTNGRTYGRAEGHLRPTLLGRLRGVDLKMIPSNAKHCNLMVWMFPRVK